MSFNGVIGSGVTGGSGGGGSNLGLLGDTMFATQNSALMGLWMAFDSAEDVNANRLIVDSSGEGHDAVTIFGNNPSFPSFHTYQNPGPGNIINTIDTTGTIGGNHAWAGDTGPVTLTDPWTVMIFASVVAPSTQVTMSIKSITASSRDGILLRPFGTQTRLDTFTAAGVSRTIVTFVEHLGDLMADNLMHQVVISHDGSNTRDGFNCYVDGVVLNKTASFLPIVDVFTADHVLPGTAGGFTNPPAFGFQGAMGPSAYWNTALSPAEIADIFTASGL